MVWRPSCHSFYQARFPRPLKLSASAPVPSGFIVWVWYLNQWKELIDWFSDQRTDVSYAYMLAGVYGITSLASSWIISPLNYWNMTDGHNFRTQASFQFRLLIGSFSKAFGRRFCWNLKKLCALLYKKCLRLNSDGRRKITIGKIVNIMSVDVNRCDRILIPFSQVATSPILLAVAIWQIYERMGMAIWGALGTTLFFLFLNVGQEWIQKTTK